MKRSEILELAKTELWNGKDPTWSQFLWRKLQEKLGYRSRLGSSEYICFAIERACSTSRRYLSGSQDVQESLWSVCYFVESKLEGHSTYIVWMQVRHGVFYATKEAEQAARLAWLNELIAESKAEGK